MGLSYEETQLIPLSELLDLISVEHIKTAGFRFVQPMTDEEELDYILTLR